MSKTRLQLRTQALFEADMTGLIEDTDANAIIQEECGELYDMLVEAFEDYAISTSGNLTPSGSNDYVSLPADFYKLRAVDVLSAGTTDTWSELEAFSLEERNDLGSPRYLIHGDRLMIRPTTLAATTTVRLYYTPTCPVFSDDVTGFDGRGFEKRIVLACAARFKAIEQSDTSELASRLQAIDKRIEKMRTHRNSARPKQVADVRRDATYYLKRGVRPEDIF